MAKFCSERRRSNGGRHTGPAGALLVLLSAALILAGCGDRDKALPGQREQIRPDLTLASATPGATIRTRPISLPAPVVNADWNSRNGGASGRPADQPAFAAVPSIRWSRDIGNGSSKRNPLIVTPIVAGGLVFAMDAAGQLSAQTLQGQPLWRQNLVPEGQRPETGPGGGLAQSGGVLFATTGFGEAFAIDPASGRILWRKDFSAPIRSAPVVDGGQLIFVMRDDKAAAVSVTDGALLWEIESAGGTGLLGGATPAASGALVVIPFASGELRGVSASDGLWRWGTAITTGRRDFARSAIDDITGDPVISGSSVYAASQSGRMIRVNRETGERIWTILDGAYGPVWPAGDSIFFVSDRGELVRATADRGEKIWSVPLPQFYPNRNWFGDRTPFRAITHFGPILAGNRLWIASGDGMLRAYSPTDGSLLVKITLPAGAAAPPVVAGGLMFLVTEKGQLLALQ
jgi:outer membrane protein assembly factor BamB